LSILAPEFQSVQTYPFDCPLCGHKIESAEDRTRWHGLGKCADICELCGGSGELEGAPCPPCLGSGVEKGPKA
jgi:DnaJ-class molecular chaperone